MTKTLKSCNNTSQMFCEHLQYIKYKYHNPLTGGMHNENYE